MNPVELPDFRLDRWKVRMGSLRKSFSKSSSGDSQVEKVVLEYPNGQWDELILEFRFRRLIGFYLTQVSDVL